jgi:plasmid stabilization system protein ParE
MKRFLVLLEARATRELDRIRAEGRAPHLDDAVGAALERLEVLPEMGPPAWLRGRWSKTIRKLSLGRTGYLLYYRVHFEAELIQVLNVWHERRRAPRL